MEAMAAMEAMLFPDQMDDWQAAAAPVVAVAEVGVDK